MNSETESNSQQESPVVLSDANPVAVGGHRLCYLHPDHDGRCIKVMKKTSVRTGPDDENELEHKAYLALEKTADDIVWQHIPRCYGMVETDLGRGIVIDYLCEPDGSPALTVKARIAKGIDRSFQDALDEFKKFLTLGKVRLGDMHIENLLVCNIANTGRERFYIADGLSNRHLIWHPIFRFLHPHKIRRKIKRLEYRIFEQGEILAGRQTSIRRKRVSS